MASRPTVHVVDDDEAMREATAELLRASGYRTRTYSSAEELLALDAAGEPGCVLSDLRMPGMDGLALVRHLQGRHGALPVVLITGHGDVPLAVEAMKAGAADFLEKPIRDTDLLQAVATALRSRQGPGPDAQAGEAARRRLEPLTTREREVLECLVGGESNKVVAARLGVSPRTVEFHRARIMEKTAASGVAELVRIWLAAGPRG